MSFLLYFALITVVLSWCAALFRVIYSHDIPKPIAVIALSIGLLGALGPIIILLWPSATEKQLREGKE